MEKAVFVAYPYKIEGYRESIARACTGLATPFYADNELLGSHVLDKIRNQMQRADLCLFDLSGRNFNVALELGIAMALELNYRVLICENDLPEPADLGGWDQLRYENLVDLSLRLRDRLHSPEIFQTHRRSISDRQFAVQPVLHIQLHSGTGGPDGHFLVGFIRNIGRGPALRIRFTIPTLPTYELGVLKPYTNTQDEQRLNIKYSDSSFFLSKLDDPTAHFDFTDTAGTSYRQDVPIVQKLTPGGSIMGFSITGADPPYLI